MTTKYDAFEPYPEPRDSLSLGQMRYAAKHGDQRAALTLRNIDQANGDPAQPGRSEASTDR